MDFFLFNKNLCHLYLQQYNNHIRHKMVFFSKHKTCFPYFYKKPNIFKYLYLENIPKSLPVSLRQDGFYATTVLASSFLYFHIMYYPPFQRWITHWYWWI